MDTVAATAIARRLCWTTRPTAAALSPKAKAAACRAAFARGRATPATGLFLLDALFKAGAFDEALAFAGDNPRPEGTDPAWDISLIHILLATGQKARALAQAEAALRVVPDHIGLLRERAEMLIRLNRGAEAVADVVQLLERGDQALSPLMTRLLMEHKDPAWLLAMLDRRPALFLPGEAPLTRVQCLLALGRTAEALDWMDVDRLLLQAPLPLPVIGDADLFRRAVVDEITGAAATGPKPSDVSTLGGVQTSVPLDGMTHMPVLLAAIRARIDRYADDLPADHPFTAMMPRAATLQAWSVCLGPGGRQAPHTHPSGWLSGVFYLAAPEVDETAGALVIPTTADLPRTLVPEAGKLVLFPSYFMHTTLPHRSGQPRICVAFDVVPDHATAGAGVP
ncbi:putative 2OG-Fe(II) oxygenase [Tistrella mobilis]|uniref:TPR repeat-containing protein n=1 Tax=Tistrella mobilis (strain KA081020-065) TaxID=1110502 RepID=I3TRM5_TISMK|nr:putative 2OG-Fe(II) oxygenase [Tistrella mobilis]AFK55413.1 TPR repeat-containing protein [Tistrella mobilis KA081020-065]